MLKAHSITVKVQEKTLIDGVGFTLNAGEWLMIVGRNGAGKSTLVNAVSQKLNYEGIFEYDGVDIKRFKPAEFVKRIGVMKQGLSVDYSFTVGEVVKMGRYAYSQGLFSTLSKKDEEMIEYALNVCGLSDIANQSILTLSGGELQRTFLAQLFALDPNILVLDEPTSHLDITFQKQLFDLISDWLKHEGKAVITVVHDLSLAKAYGTHTLLLSKGRAVAFGETEEVLTKANLEEAYGLDVYSLMNELLGKWGE
ncbi:MAG TPA: ABC transporter ATP-binding protein [Clostridiales bacterium]|nr:ABC transporter ATP-binding protein [Clostridiales bacterium]